MLEQLKEYKNIKDKFESLYTFVVYDSSIDKLVEFLFQKLKILQKINDNVRKKYLNDRLYSLILYLKNDQNRTINSILLLGKDINEIPLTKNYISVLKECLVPEIIIKNGEYFDLEYVTLLLTDLSFYKIINVNNNKMTVHLVNSTKSKVFFENESSNFNLEEYIKEHFMQDVINKKLLVKGSSSHIKKLKMDNLLIFNKNITNEEAFEIFEKEEMKDRHKLLEECFQMMKNEKTKDKVLLGKELKEGIKNYMIKQVFCTSKVLETLKKNVPSQYLNFPIVVIKSLNKGDVGDQLDELNGLIGLTYY